MSLHHYRVQMRPFVFATAAGASVLLLSSCMTKEEYEFEPSPRIQQEIAYCMVHSACDGQDLTSCLLEIREGGEIYGASPGWYARRDACVKSASSCAEYQQCLTQHTFGGACDPATFTARCDGERLVQCAQQDGVEGGVEISGDCALDGQRCVQSDSGAARCGWPVACDAGCEGESFFQCVKDSDLPQRFVCTRSDQQCEPELPGCVDRKQPKTPCDQHHCEGTKLVTCVKGKTTSVDCAKLHPHMTCRMVNGDAQCSVQLGAVECDADTDRGSCHGTTARVCVAGRQLHIDCARTFDATCVDTEAGVRCATTPDFVEIPPD